MAVKLNESQKRLIEDNASPENQEKVLEVSNLVISFKTDNGKVQAVRGVSFDLIKGETLCIVGESGSGKSVTSKAIMGILSPNAIVENGSIIYQGEDLLQVSEEEFHRIRGHKIGMIFQDPLSSLNPIVRIGKQITETMLINPDQLKNYFNDLIAPELTAYTNARVVRDGVIRKANYDYTGLLEDHKKTLSAKKKEKAPKEEIASLKAEYKASEAEAKKARDQKIAEAREKYNSVAPSLRAKLSERKASARVETKQHAEDLRKDYLAKAAEKDKEIAAITMSEENKKKLLEVESEIKRENVRYGLLFALNYFFNKRKQKLRAAHLARLEELKAKRLDIPQVKELDDLKAEKVQAEKEYRSQIRITKAMAKERAIEVMREVGIPEPEKRFKQFPFQFSGGMRQRIVIAIALIANPDVLICDEPTTALDVTIQAQILELINKLKAARKMSVIFITHDLGVVANMADRVAVMYAGKIVEYGTDKEIFFDPRHPYTWALLSSIPDINSKEKLVAIPGTPPDMIYPPKGDAFALRNQYALAIDFKYEPPFFEISKTHKVASWLEYKDAKDVVPPKIVTERIYKALEEEGALLKDEKR